LGDWKRIAAPLADVAISAPPRIPSQARGRPTGGADVGPLPAKDIGDLPRCAVIRLVPLGLPWWETRDISGGLARLIRARDR